MVLRLTPTLVIQVPSVEPDIASGRPDANPRPSIAKTRLLRNASMNAPMGSNCPAGADGATFRVDSFVCTSGAKWRAQESMPKKEVVSRALQGWRGWHADCTCWIASPATNQRRSHHAQEHPRRPWNRRHYQLGF